MPSSDAPIRCCASLASPDLTEEQAEAAAAVFKALADPSRVRIVSVLATADRPVCACELEAPTGLSQPTVSHHMKRLVKSGLVATERRGTWTFYRLDPEACGRLGDLCALHLVSRDGASGAVDSSR